MRTEHERIVSLPNDSSFGRFEVNVVVEFGVNTVQVRLIDPQDPEVSYGTVDVWLYRNTIKAELTGELAASSATLHTF